MEPIFKLLSLFKGGPYIGPRGGKWADAKHTIPWKGGKPKARPTSTSRRRPIAAKKNDFRKDPGIDDGEKEDIKYALKEGYVTEDGSGKLWLTDAGLANIDQMMTDHEYLPPYSMYLEETPTSRYKKRDGGVHTDINEKHFSEEAVALRDANKSEDKMIPKSAALSKGLHSFHAPKGSIPDKWLSEYVDSFIEEANEHERRESSHTDPHLASHSQDTTGYFAGCVYRELLAYAANNNNLKRALSKFSIDAAYVEGRMRELGLLHVDSENHESNQQASEAGYHPTPMALSEDVHTRAAGERAEAMSKGFGLRDAPTKVSLGAGPDPMALLRKSIASQEHPLRSAPKERTFKVNPACLQHRDGFAAGLGNDSVVDAQCLCGE